jgi:two-component system, OmpR family, response regulator VanR
VEDLNFKFLKNLNILYVEDDHILASQTISLLEHFFENVFHLDNAEDALDVLASSPIHILITDIGLPGMSGLELCENIRTTNSNMPIFITTMHDDKEKLKRAVKLNLIDYLVKPIGVESIKKTLLESLKRLQESSALFVRINNGVSYFPLRWEIQVLNDPIALTQKEANLLDLLLKNKNQALSRESIERSLYPNEPLSESGYKSLIYRLRKKIGKESIVSLSGIGIKLITTTP